jgi:oligopeptide transport system ATP-binding protein
MRNSGQIRAVDGITFNIYPGETLGLVGESGCGKSTTGLLLLMLEKPTSGRIFFEETEISALDQKEIRPFRQRMQMIFQDPYSSLDPRMTIAGIIGEPIREHNHLSSKEIESRINELLELVGLHKDFANRYPHEFSGGQRQRVGIARAIALNPAFIVCDEPISALDVSIQAQIINLLKALQDKLGLTYLFIAHDLSIVRYISDRVAVMYLGKIVEITDKKKLYIDPIHPYTRALLSAVPIPDPEVEENRIYLPLEGEIPSPENPPLGCNFNTRCPFAEERCFLEEPEMREFSPSHWAACFWAEDQSSERF